MTLRLLSVHAHPDDESSKGAATLARYAAPLPEGCFAALPLDEAAAPLVALIREFRPHVVITYDESGGDPHPNHIPTPYVPLEAFSAAADPARYPGTGEPWKPQKLYYQAVLSRAWFQTLHDATLAAGLESAMGPVLDELPAGETLTVTTRIRCETHFATRDRALPATKPRSTWLTRSSPTHEKSNEKPGPTRTTTWPTPLQAPTSKTTCSPE